MDKYDIVIVGAGPAGVMAALHSKGDVLLIEKNKQIGKPVRCAEGLYGKILDTFNVRDCAEDSHILHDVEFNFPNGKRKRFTIRSNDIFVLNKEKFLNNILRKAKTAEDKNITVLKNTKASYKHGFIQLNDGEYVDGKVIIDCGGISSPIGRAAGMTEPLKQKDIHLCAQYTIQGGIDPDVLRLFAGNPYAPTGYVWVFPKGDGRANVGLGLLSSQHPDVKSYLDKFIDDKYPECKKDSYFTAPVCLAPPVDKCVKENIILTGDSCHLTVSLSGAGIGSAMLSGTCAGEVASNYIKGDTCCLYSYQVAMENMLYGKLWKAYRRKEKMLQGNRLDNLYKYASFLLGLHSLFPRTTERFALKNFRF